MRGGITLFGAPGFHEELHELDGLGEEWTGDGVALEELHGCLAEVEAIGDDSGEADLTLWRRAGARGIVDAGEGGDLFRGQHEAANGVGDGGIGVRGFPNDGRAVPSR